MDLLLLVIVVVIIGFGVHLLTTKVPMPPYWASTIQIFTLIAIVFYLIFRFGSKLPNVLP